MIKLYVAVLDKVATYYKRCGNIVCGNSDYQIEFSFDSEWDEFPVKTARFVHQSGYTDVVFEGNVCDVPVLRGIDSCSVGVFAGDIHTTTPAVIPCLKSILCDGGAPVDPPEDVYNQIMELLSNSGGGGGGSLNPDDYVKAVKTSDRTKVYAVNSNGDQIMVGTSPYSSNDGMIPIYNKGGTLNVATPTSDNQAANKGYVDTALGDISTALDELHSYAQSLVIGGDA